MTSKVIPHKFIGDQRQDDQYLWRVSAFLLDSAADNVGKRQVPLEQRRLSLGNGLPCELIHSSGIVPAPDGFAGSRLTITSSIVIRRSFTFGSCRSGFSSVRVSIPANGRVYAAFPPADCNVCILFFNPGARLKPKIHFYRCAGDAERGFGLELLHECPPRTGMVGPATVGASFGKRRGGTDVDGRNFFLPGQKDVANDDRPTRPAEAATGPNIRTSDRIRQNHTNRSN